MMMMMMMTMMNDEDDEDDIVNDVLHYIYIRIRISISVSVSLYHFTSQHHRIKSHHDVMITVTHHIIIATSHIMV